MSAFGNRKPSPWGDLRMIRKGIWLIFIILALAGCATTEEARWAMLGDSNEQAFFLDRQQVQRLPNGNYSYTVKIRPYQEGSPHALDETRDTNQVLFIEMNCRDRQWTETGRASMENSGKLLFRFLNPAPRAQTVEPGTIHQAAYSYLCGHEDITAEHHHQQ